MKATRLLLVLFIVLSLAGALAAKEDEPTGEALFARNCAPCHPGGGNILNREKTLSAKDRAENNILTADDIVKKMRNPGAFNFHPNKWSGMKIFDEKTLSDADAKKIADYIVKAFP